MYKIDIQNKKLIPLTQTIFLENGLKERYDIQEWIEKNPEILDEDLLIIQKEFVLPSGKRLDLLAIDRDGKLVIIELKRDDSGASVEWQAIKYASYCSRFNREDIINLYAKYRGSDREVAEGRIEDFVNSIDHLNQEQRIIMVAREFHSDVASAAFWLREKYNLDIKCVKMLPFLDTDGTLFLDSDVIIPLKEISDYIILAARKNTENRMEDEEGKEGKSTYYSESGTYSGEELRQKLIQTINERKDTIVGLLPFLYLLLRSEKKVGRDELVQYLVDMGFSDAGRKANKVSQILTKKSTDVLRQIIDFDGKQAGARKDNFCIKNEYRTLVQEIVSTYFTPGK